MDDAFGLDPTSDEFQAVKREMERLARNHNSLVRAFCYARMVHSVSQHSRGYDGTSNLRWGDV